MGLFRKSTPKPTTSQTQENTEPYEVHNELDLTRNPPTVRIKWSDGKTTHHKPGTDYTR